MLAGIHTPIVRALRISTPLPSYVQRPFRATFGRSFCATGTRAIYAATAEFTNLEPDGRCITKQITIDIGSPGEAYVLLPTEVGNAMRATGSHLLHQSSFALFNRRSDRFALTFFHDTKHFGLKSSPDCLRLAIPQQLPRQSAGNTSPATLYLYGVMHTIALDGTPDAEFAEIVSTVYPEIGEALDKLKDM